jgi:hypothetical protein
MYGAERISRISEACRRRLDLGWKVWQRAVEISRVKPDVAEARVDSPYSGVEVDPKEWILDLTELARLIGAVLRLARCAPDVIRRTRRIADGLRRVIGRQMVVIEWCGREVGVVQPKLVVEIS